MQWQISGDKMKYKILESKYMFDLESEVNKHIEGGWKPQGGVAWHPTGFNDKWVQAVVKE